jgi:hypothetical protein
MLTLVGSLALGVVFAPTGSLLWTASSGAAFEPSAQQMLLGDGELGEGLFGSAVAISTDSQTALVGGPGDGGDAGGVWVFTRSDSTWTQETKLTSGETAGEGRGESHFGRAVAVSADGDTALVGGPGAGADAGAVWVFTRSGSTWTQQEKLTVSDEVGVSHFGRSVALSGDGDTAVIGGPGDGEGEGAVWVFTRSGSTWAEQEKLTPGDEAGEGGFGRAVSMSAAGNAALVGGPGDDSNAGAAWVFARSGSTWTQQGGKLTGKGEQGGGQFGESVALSGDGETGLIGGPVDSEGTGAAWVFARSGSTWSQQGGKLVSGGHRERYFGSGVALSATGNLALVGDFAANGKVGGAWMFARSGSTWTKLGFYLTGDAEEEGEGQLGRSVALPGDGETALVGGPGDDERTGGAWMFAGLPQLSGPPEEEGHKKLKTSESPPEQPSTARGGTETPATGQVAKGEVLGTKEAGRPPVTGVVRLVSTHIVVSRSGRAAVKLACTGTGRCVGRVTLSIRTHVKGSPRAKSSRSKKATTRTIAIGTVAFSIAPGRTSTVALKLTHSGGLLLSAGHGRLTVGLKLRKSLPAPVQTRTATVHLALQKPRKTVKLKK